MVMLQKYLVLLLISIFFSKDFVEVLATPNDENQRSNDSKKETTSECGIVPDSCPDTCYRSFDGSCNNLLKPWLGTPNTRYQRLLPPKYGDGHSSPSKARSGDPLPSARKVSATLNPDIPIPDLVWTLLAMQYGQFMVHDMSNMLQREQLSCCSPDGQMLKSNPEFCYPISVPADDPDYAPYKTKCLNFIRTVTDKDRHCIGNRSNVEQLTSVTHYLDLSDVYGNGEKQNHKLRTFSGGRLISEIRNEQELLPTDANLGLCTKVKENEPCYVAGDTRVNQSPHLAILQTLWLRQHNKVADALARLNPHWHDDCLFQEARKICIAMHQQMSYYEWLQIFIGKKNAYDKKNLYHTKDHVNDYDKHVDPSVLNGHATATSRFFHSLIAGILKLESESRNTISSVRISTYWDRPVIIEQKDSFDSLTRGLCTQGQYAADAYFDKEITNDWIRLPNETMGDDLRSLDIQRSMDHALASYNDYRQLAGLREAKTFLGFADAISLKNIHSLATLYEHVDDVPLTVGGSLELIIPGTLAGPTFLHIMKEQFYRTRVGDRFWFENSGETGFSLPQLHQIRKATIAKFVCDNSGIKLMQPEGFRKISLTNPVVPCSMLPSVDLSFWKDSKNDGCACLKSTASTTESTTETEAATTETASTETETDTTDADETECDAE